MSGQAPLRAMRTAARAAAACLLLIAPAALAADADHATPAQPAEVRFAWFGPSNPADPDSGPFWNGATLAVEEINAAGGIQSRPVRLMPAWSENPWAGGVNRLTRLIYDDQVLAIVGSVDGAATHLAEQVAAKALVAVVSPGSTDPTVNLAGVPWMYSLLPGDDVQARAVAERLAAGPDRTPIVLVSATDHDSRAAATAFRTALRTAGLAFAAAFECAPDAADAGAIAGQSLTAAPRVVVLLASPAASGRIAAALRAAGFEGTITGGSNLARRRFLDTAGDAAQGVVAPLVHDPDTPLWEAFSRAYTARFGDAPDFASAAAYDSVRLTADAARRARLDPARLRTVIPEVCPWTGVTGEIRFDPRGRNAGPIPLVTVRMRPPRCAVSTRLP